MKAARLTKVTTGLTKYSLAVILLSAGIGTACGAQAPNNASNPGFQPPVAQNAPDLGSIAASANGGNVTSPKLQAAIDRVTKAKNDLELAKKRLNASKVIVKAADAEYKAAKADQQAVSLQGQAQELADATGISERNPATTPPNQPAVTQAPAGVGQNDDSAQNYDFAGTPFTGVPSPGK